MKNLNDIDDFELKNSTQSDDINTLYQKYREFKRALKQIPLKTLQHNNWLSNYGSM